MAISLRPRITLTCLIMALAGGSGAPRPAVAQSSLEQQLLGLGAAVILNQMNRPQQQQQQQQARPQQQGQAQTRQQAPQVDPARQAAMDLQRDLNALGFDAGPVDGLPGARTRRAIEAYQVSRGFAATGSLTAMQRVALETDVRARASGGVETAELRRSEIYEVQSYLAELGYDPGTPDGAWGPRSQAAMDAFRRDAGLATGGMPPAPQDEAALYARVHGVSPSARPGMERVAVAQTMAPAFAPAATAPAAAAQAGPSFDCARAGTATEWAICGDPQLAALDRQLAAAWSTATRAAGGSAALMPRQRAWMGERDACGADTACIAARIGARITELTGAPPAPAGGAAAGGFAVASFGVDGISAGSGGQPATGVAGDLPPPGGGAWVHLAGNRVIEAPDGLPRRLTLAAIKLSPDTLADDNTILRSLTAERAAQTGRPFNQVSADLSRLNPLERQDAIATHRQALLDAAQRVADVTPQAPMPVAIYEELSQNAATGRMTYSEGRGLVLRGDTEVRATLPTGPGFGGGFAVTALLPGIDVLPMDREAASAFLNRYQEQHAQRRRLVQVVWGRVTRLGADESVADFASTNVTGAGLYGGAFPATFVPERVTLHYVDRSDGPGLVGPDTPVIHEWPLDAGGGQVTGGRDALAVARELGLPIEDGHVLALQGSSETQRAWTTFLNLAWVGANPEAARQGDAFGAIAVSLLPEAQKRAFFGDQRADANYNLAASFPEGQPSRLDSVASSFFRDEFLREDAKRAFLTQYYDGILARAPVWPLPMLHKVQVQLGEYDFDTQAFPLQGLEGQVLRVAAGAQPQVTNRTRQDLYSVDRFGNLPARLPMPPDQARLLRDALRAANPYGGSEITLAWWSDLDWGTDATAIENRFGDRSEVRDGEVRPGRATLKRVALFLDPALTQPLMEIDPQAVLIPNPEPPEELAERAPDDAMVRVQTAERASGQRLLAAVARGLGGDEVVWERIARSQTAVQQANEFDRPGAVAATVAALRAQPEGALWIDGTARLSEYDLEAGTFGFPQGSGYVRYLIEGDTGAATVKPVLVGADPFQSLSVAPDLARGIVESAGPGDRRVRFLMRATPEGVTDSSHPQTAAQRPAFDLVLRPQEVIFWLEGASRQGPPEAILAVIDYGDRNAAEAERIDRRFDAAEFAALAELRPVLDPHVMDLLLVARGGVVPEGEAADAMMLSAWQHETGPAPLPGPEFFGTAGRMPQGAEAALLRPAFASWMQARGQALGDRFAVEMQRAGTQPPCGVAAEPGGMYLGDRAVAQAVPLLREDANSVAQRARDGDGAFDVPRRYAMFQQRPSARYSGNCEQWFGFVVVADAVHEGRDGAVANGTRLEFELDEVRAFAGNSPVPDMVVTGRAQATRLFQDDGPGAPVVAAPPEPQAEPEPEPQVAAQSAPPAAATPAAIASPQPETVAPEAADAWPDLADVPIDPADIDVLGLRTGQSLAEAERIILERGGVLAAFETPAGLSQFGSPALAYRRVYVTRDGTETLSLGSYAPDGPVVALMRRMVLPEGTLPYDRIAEQLADKYGAPDTNGLPPEAEVMDGLSAWVRDVTDPAAQVCAMVPFSSPQLTAMRRLDGIGDTGWRPKRGGRTAWQLGLPDFPPELLGYTEPCGVALVYLEERPEVWGASGFSLVMVDFDAIRAVETALSAEDVAVDLEIEF